MKKFKQQFSGKTAILILATILVSSCQSKSDNSEISLENIPAFTPKELISFDQVGDFYFSHLGYSSAVLENGDILIPERNNSALVVVDSEGNLKKKIREGRGPGEVLDAYNFVQDSDKNIYVYDQGNKKLIEYDSEANFSNQLIPKQNRSFSIQRAYLMPDSTFIFELFSFAFLMDKNKDHEVILAQFDPVTNSYGEEIVLKDQPYARLELGATEVPYTHSQLLAYHPEHKSLLTFDTRTNIIAEIDANFDTLSAVELNLPKEKLSRAELDTIRNQQGENRWKYIEPLLPEYKSVAQEMMYFNDRIWLKSNLRGNFIKWLVLNMNGDIEQIVHLPQESMLTHISEHHLGLRLDDVTFALYEPVVFE